MNEDKFSGKAVGYAAYRPTYPDALFDWLFGDIGFRAGDPVADVGAGTGIFSDRLLRRGCRVYAVEPNPDMRRLAEKALGADAGFTLVPAPAEHTGLPDSAVAWVTAAQAFHWFDRADFATECRRILRPGGGVALVWNNRVADDPVTRETYELNKRLCPGFKGFSGGTLDAEPSFFSGFFRDGECAEREFEHGFTVDRDAFVGRALSSSYAPGSGEKNHREYVEGLRELFDRHARDGRLHQALVCRAFAGKV